MPVVDSERFQLPPGAGRLKKGPHQRLTIISTPGGGFVVATNEDGSGPLFAGALLACLDYAAVALTQLREAERCS